MQGLLSAAHSPLSGPGQSQETAQWGHENQHVQPAQQPSHRLLEFLPAREALGAAAHWPFTWRHVQDLFWF